MVQELEMIPPASHRRKSNDNTIAKELVFIPIGNILPMDKYNALKAPPRNPPITNPN